MPVLHFISDILLFTYQPQCPDLLKDSPSHLHSRCWGCFFRCKAPGGYGHVLFIAPLRKAEISGLLLQAWVKQAMEHCYSL